MRAVPKITKKGLEAFIHLPRLQITVQHCIGIPTAQGVNTTQVKYMRWVGEDMSDYAKKHEISRL